MRLLSPQDSEASLSWVGVYSLICCVGFAFILQLRRFLGYYFLIPGEFEFQKATYYAVTRLIVIALCLLASLPLRKRAMPASGRFYATLLRKRISSLLLLLLSATHFWLWGAWAMFRSALPACVEPPFAVENKYTILAVIFLLSPIAEEFVFRKFLVEGLLHLKVNVPISILISGVVFGCYHAFYADVFGVFMIGVVGFLLSALYVRTRSVFLVSVAHMASNILVSVEHEVLHWIRGVPYC